MTNDNNRHNDSKLPDKNRKFEKKKNQHQKVKVVKKDGTKQVQLVTIYLPS